MVDPDASAVLDCDAVVVDDFADGEVAEDHCHRVRDQTPMRPLEPRESKAPSHRAPYRPDRRLNKMAPPRSTGHVRGPACSAAISLRRGDVRTMPL